MWILTVRTDKPDAEIGLYRNEKKVVYEEWLAHRQLAESIHQKISRLIKNAGLGWHDIEGMVAFKGPGSFTGLRIGLSVVNALAESLKIPVVGSANDDWIQVGIKDLLNGKNDSLIKPEYGAEAKTTTPKK